MRGALSDGDQIRNARVSRGLTQEQLAALADVDVKTVRKAEQGKRLDVGTLVQLAIALGADVESVLHAGCADSAVQAARRKAVEKWVAAWDAQDIDALLEVYHDHAIVRLPGAPNIPFGGTFVGKEEIRRGNLLAWATTQTTPQTGNDYSLIASDDTVILDGAKVICLPNGDRFRLSSVQIFTFDGDRVVDHRVEYDTLALQKLLELPSAGDSPGSTSENSR